MACPCRFSKINDMNLSMHPYDSPPSSSRSLSYGVACEYLKHPCTFFMRLLVGIFTIFTIFHAIMKSLIKPCHKVPQFLISTLKSLSLLILMWHGFLENPCRFIVSLLMGNPCAFNVSLKMEILITTLIRVRA